ncbi:pilus assembly protein [Pseudomonas sp. B2M1-30]|uniref:Pilus assembly protein n=1 Tax=Pseudomonas koreensis TaxID=198620 RepID=A0A9X2XJ87_9PSED|nr:MULTISPECIES: TadE/TadG family type IV pilus assembly protein [Pseudomonas]MCU0117980.1 pilus assembly protein [Pseudomonas sp. B2M1-30]MCU7249507.1 pilus assembly protein [Pseudomonas koreensis]MCU7263472.1 pilus assembly protein [Pseudomonas koreensis]
MKTALPRKQKGAVAIEFALVFVIFFAVFYGLVSYSLPLLLMQAFTQSTAEAVRRSVALDPSTANYATVIQSVARNELALRLAWLPTALNFNATTDTTITYVGGLLTVRINYPTSKLNQALPFLVLPGIGTVPNLPANLTASSSLQF